MTQFLVSLIVFLLLHTVPALPGLRAALIERIGRRAYLVVYSLTSIFVLGWVFRAALTLDFVPLWDARPWQAWMPLILTPLGLFFLLAGLLSPNPLSISMRRADAAPGAILAITRHPVLWGFALWSGSHLVPNGDLRSVLLFGALFVFALAGIPLAERRARKRLATQWQAVSGQTAIIPFTAILSGRARIRVDTSLAIALLLTLAMTIWLLLGGHAVMFGADPLALALA